MTEVLMQSTVSCNDKLVSGIEAVSTDALNFIAKTLASNDPKIRSLLGITREFVPVEYIKSGPQTFIVEARALAGGATEFFEYSNVKDEHKLNRFKPKLDSRPAPESGLSALYEVSFDLLKEFGVSPLGLDDFNTANTGQRDKKVKKKLPPTPIIENNPCLVGVDKLILPDLDILRKK